MEHPEIRGLSEWRPLARGAYADIWEARQLSLDRLVAVKVYRLGLDEAGRRRFRREAAAAGRLPYHPGIVTAHGAGRLPDERPYLILELFAAGSLSTWLQPENRPSAERVRQVGVRLADALAAVHACGVLHRDVRPGNILLDRNGQPGLTDFGLAAVGSAGAAEAQAVPLTSAYAPPEARRGDWASESGDVFSLAATLHALLTGETPGPSTPRGTGPDVHAPVADVLRAALSDDPAERPTAAAFRDQLAKASLADAPTRRHVVPAVAPSTGEAGAAEAVPARTRRRVGVLALVAASVTLIGATSTWLVRDPDPSSAPGVAGPTTPGGNAPSAPSSTSVPASPAADDRTRSGAEQAAAIRLENSTDVAKPFQTVRIQGRYEGGGGRLVRVQRWEDGRWRAFPLPTKIDRSGQLTAFVELGQPGRHRIRVLDPGSGVTSDPLVLVIRA